MYTIPHNNFTLVKNIDYTWSLIENFDEKRINDYIDSRKVCADEALCQTSKTKYETEHWAWHASRIIFTCGYVLEDF